MKKSILRILPLVILVLTTNMCFSIAAKGATPENVVKFYSDLDYIELKNIISTGRLDVVLREKSYFFISQKESELDLSYVNKNGKIKPIDNWKSADGTIMATGMIMMTPSEFKVWSNNDFLQSKLSENKSNPKIIDFFLFRRTAESVEALLITNAGLFFANITQTTTKREYKEYDNKQYGYNLESLEIKSANEYMNLGSLYVDGQEMKRVAKPIFFGNTMVMPLEETLEALGGTVIKEQSTSNVYFDFNGVVYACRFDALEGYPPHTKMITIRKVTNISSFNDDTDMIPLGAWSFSGTSHIADDGIYLRHNTGLQLLEKLGCKVDLDLEGKKISVSTPK